MTDKTTAPDLAALSAAATQGEWSVDGPPHNRIIWSSPNDRVCFMAHSDGRDVARDMATPAFITTLVNEHRAGRLMQIDPEGMRERVAWRMWKAEADRAAPNVGRNRTLEAFQNDTRPDERERWLGLADAAIAAMMGETK